jgi:hypothetical protein
VAPEHIFPVYVTAFQKSKFIKKIKKWVGKISYASNLSPSPVACRLSRHPQSEEMQRGRRLASV